MTEINYIYNDSNLMNIKFDNGGKIIMISNFNKGLLNGFRYYFTENKLDSIIRYIYGIEVSERYYVNENSEFVTYFYGLNLAKYKKSERHKVKYWQLKDKEIAAYCVDSFDSIGTKIIGVPYEKYLSFDKEGKVETIYEFDTLDKFSGSSIYLNDIYNQNQIIGQTFIESLWFSNDFYLNSIYLYTGEKRIPYRLIFDGENRKTRLLSFYYFDEQDQKHKELYFSRKGRFRKME